MVNKISDGDRAVIISEFSASVEEGASKEILDYIRRDLEIRFCPHKYSPQQVSAVCSQVIIQRNRIQKSLRKVEKKKNEIEDKMEISEDEFGESISNTNEDPYDNPQKKAWRQAITSFASRHLKKVGSTACLPAENWHEVSEIYDALNIPRNLIFGAEANPNLKGKFLNKSNELGTNAFDGKFEDMMKSSDRRYSFVNLDFRGQMCLQSFNILRDLLLDDEAILILNFMRRREPQNIQKILKGHAYAYTAAIDGPEVRGLVRRNEFYGNNMLRGNNKSNIKIRDAIDTVACFLYSQNIGCAREENWLFPDRVKKLDELIRKRSKDIKETEYEFIYPAVVWAASKIEKSLREQTKCNADEFCRSITEFLPNLVYDTLLQRSQLVEIESYDYLSPTGNSPFLTQMCKYETPRNEYRRLKETINFFLDICDYYFSQKNSDELGTIRIEDIQQRVITKNDRLSSRDRFVCRDKNGQKMGVLRCQKFIEDDRIYTDIYNKSLIAKNAIAEGR